MLNAHTIDQTNPVIEGPAATPEPLWFGMELPECETTGCHTTVAAAGEKCEECAATELDVARQVRLIEAGRACEPALL
jgi:hypothetical protein